MPKDHVRPFAEVAHRHFKHLGVGHIGGDNEGLDHDVLAQPLSVVYFTSEFNLRGQRTLLRPVNVWERPDHEGFILLECGTME